MKWIGQHIWPFKSRFRSDVVVEKDSSVYMGTSEVLYNSSGTVTLKNIDALDAGSVTTLSTTLSSDFTPVDTAHDTAGTAASVSGGDTTAGTTNNIAGGNLTIKGGQGKGTGAGGDILFQVAVPGSSGSTLNSLSTALTISDDGTTTSHNRFIGNITGDVTGSATTAGTVTTAAQPHIESIGTDGDALNVLSDQILIQNTTGSMPLLRLTNTADDNVGPYMTLRNYRGGANAGQDADFLGHLQWRGYNDAATPSEKTFGSITTKIDDATAGQESGNMLISVASHDGGIAQGLELTGGSADGAGDVKIGGFVSGGGTNTSICTLRGVVMMPNLPTSDPSNTGQLWNDSGTLKIS